MAGMQNLNHVAVGTSDGLRGLYQLARAVGQHDGDGRVAVGGFESVADDLLHQQRVEVSAR